MKKTLMFFLSLFCFVSGAFAQNGKIVSDKWLEEHYTKREVMITVRDGAHLYTAIYEPTDGFLRSLGRDESPVMIMRTPYSLKPYGLEPGESLSGKTSGTYQGNLKGDMANYAADGYILVFQNVRGKFLSEGVYENMRPYLCGTEGAADTLRLSCGHILTDEATDIYDTVEWLLDNTANTGQVGVKGVSYPGFYATLSALSRHPAIKAVSPQAPATDWFMGDDAHHNGALCLTDCFRFGGGFYREFKKPSTKGFSNLVKINCDIYDYFKDRPLSELSAVFGDSLRFWNEMMAHPVRDSFWLDRDPSTHLKDITVPMLVVGGFYDAEDCYGAFRTYDMLKRLSPDCPLYLAAGPWYHGGWNNRTADHLSDAWFGSASGARYQDNVEYPFFTYYLRGIGEAPSKVCVLPSSETSAKTMKGKDSAPLWVEYSEWPPRGMSYSRLYISGAGSLAFSKPSHGLKTIISDPSDPVPYMNKKADSRDRAYMTADQSFVAGRKDVMTYKSDILDKPLHLAGPVKVHLSVELESDETETPDADIIVKLIDVRPDGYMMLVRGDVMPLRFRDGFDAAKPVRNGKKTVVEFTMCDIDHYFVPGHALMVQIQGSWFPLIAMNPQTFIANPVDAKASDYKKVTMSVRSAQSWLELPVCE